MQRNMTKEMIIIAVLKEAGYGPIDQILNAQWKRSNEDFDTFLKLVSPWLDRAVEQSTYTMLKDLRKIILKATDDKVKLEINPSKKWELKPAKEELVNS